MVNLNAIFKRILSFISRLLGDNVDYINGPDTLPPPLKPEEERAVFELLKTEPKKAREKLITHNLRLVVYISKKFESTGIGAEDLVSIGTIGLIKAVNTFNPEKNIKLATYASRCIENEILMYLRKTSQQRNEISIDEPLNIDWTATSFCFQTSSAPTPTRSAADLKARRKSACLLKRSRGSTAGSAL